MERLQKLGAMVFMPSLLILVSGCASIRSTSLPVEVEKGGAKEKIPTQGGMVYYLPMQRLELTLTVSEQKPEAGDADKKQGQTADAGKKPQQPDAKKPAAPAQPPKLVRNITVGESRVFGDPIARYVAQYRRNHVGSNTLKVLANADGLLSGEGGGSTTSGVAEFLRAAASARGTEFSIFTQTESGTSIGTKPNLCSEAGVYKWAFDVDVDQDTRKSLESCRISVSVCDLRSTDDSCDTPMPKSLSAMQTSKDQLSTGSGPAGKIQSPEPSGKLATADSVEISDSGSTDQNGQTKQSKKPLQDQQPWNYAAPETSGHGYFYRQKRTFSIMAHDEIRNTRQIFYVPVVGRHSPIEFLPIPRTVFADTEWKVGFADGIPTVYDIKAGGDVLGLIKLPAEVVKAYSEAVLAGVKRKSGLAEEEVKSLQQLNALAAQQVKYEACRAAAQTRDEDKIKAACN